MALDQIYRFYENTAFNAKYLLKECKGSGSFGAVYLADERISNASIRSVALKAIRGDRAPLDRIVGELKLSTTLNHPYLLRCHTSEEGQLCDPQHPHTSPIACLGLVMEIAEGTLADYWERSRKRIPQTKVQEIVRGIASALEYLHTYRDPQTGKDKVIVHQDLKPDNILQIGNIFKVGDLGVARVMGIGAAYYAARPLGTLLYMPPEVWERGSVSPAWDVWSLGAIIVELVTGQHPFPATSVDELQRRVIQDQPRIPAGINSPLLEVVKGCLIKDRKRRWTAAQVLKALTPTPPPPPPPPPIPRRWVLIGLAASGVAGAFGWEKVRQTLAGTSTGSNPGSSTPPSLTPVSRPAPASPLTLEPGSTPTPSPINQPFTEDLGSGTFLDMLYIPGGDFTMGSPASEPESYQDERPQHLVTVPPFYMGKYEVTQAQWRAVAGFPKVKQDLNPDPSYFKGNQLPVEQVSWDDVVEFCDRLSAKTRRIYRLPTEAEWEYACRAGTQTPFYFGDTITTDQVNYNGNFTYGSGKKGIYRAKTMEVDSFSANGFGLYNMHGNVWEWCADDWHDSYKDKPQALRDNGSLIWSSSDESTKLVRGGSWVSYARYCRSADRNRYQRDDRIIVLGFRLISAPRT